MMEYVWSTIDFLVMYLFALCFFKPRRRIGKRIDFIILIVVAVMASFINDYFANSDINLVVTIIFIVVVLGFFEGNWKRKLFVGSSFFAFIITIEGIVALSIGYFFHIEASEMPKLDSDITQFFQRFLTELRLILVLVLYFFSRRKKNAPERKVQKSFLIIPILSAVLIIYLHEAQIMRNSIDLIFSWIVTIIVIVINIITYILFRKQEQYHIAEGEMKNQLKEYEYQKLHYEQVEQHQQEIRKIRHDMKNQIAGIYGYLEKGEIEEGKREVCSILNQLEKAEQKLFTANAVVNGILNMKYVEIEAKQIEAKLDVKLPEILGITGTDLGVLFGNILDNAIEACNAVCSSSYMFPYKEKLYRIESVDNREGKLIASHMDGSNPKTVGTFSSGDMLESAVILNENMYYTYCELQNKILAEQEDGQAQSGQAMGSNCSLNRLNLDTLEQTEIVKLEDVSHILMLGGTKEYQVCAVVKDDGVQYNLFDYESGTLTEISLNTVDYQRVEVTQDGKGFYYIGDEGKSLYCYHIDSKENEKIVQAEEVGAEKVTVEGVSEEGILFRAFPENELYVKNEEGISNLKLSDRLPTDQAWLSGINDITKDGVYFTYQEKYIGEKEIEGDLLMYDAYIEKEDLFGKTGEMKVIYTPRVSSAGNIVTEE